MLPKFAVPSAVVPIALQVIVVPDAGAETEMPSPVKNRRTKPLMTVPVPPATVSAEVPGPALDPWSRIKRVGVGVLHEAPGWVDASIDTCSVIAGSGESRVMVCDPAPGIANVMSSDPGLAFASRMAWRSDPWPGVASVVTTKLVAFADVTGRNNSPETRDKVRMTPH